jgi:hypothetical protein
VYAESIWGFGVSGFGWEGEGVIGASAYSSAIFGVSSANGPDPGPFPGFIAGVFGTSAENAGVIGTSYEQAGVLGYSNNNIGVYGETANSASYAGFFKGNVKVNGTLTATVKHAVVPFPDGTQRLLHCMESPEHWFEDFGSARLKSGRAIVNLDADFAKVIKRGDYRVFVTPKAIAVVCTCAARAPRASKCAG